MSDIDMSIDERENEQSKADAQHGDAPCHTKLAEPDTVDAAKNSNIPPIQTADELTSGQSEPERSSDVTDFEIFALDHRRHNHCQACGGCLLDPSHIVQGYPVWCVGCRDRIKRQSPKGAPLPWVGGWEFVYATEPLPTKRIER